MRFKSPLWICVAWSDNYRAISRGFLHDRYSLESTREKWFSHAKCHSLRLIAQNFGIPLTALRGREKLLTAYGNPLHHFTCFLPFCCHVIWCDPSIYSLHLRDKISIAHLSITLVCPSLDLTFRDKIFTIHLPISLVRPSIDLTSHDKIFAIHLSISHFRSSIHSIPCNKISAICLLLALFVYLFT